MARGIIGGIVLSTLVTLVMVPVFYVLVERFRGLFVRLDEVELTPVDVTPPQMAAGLDDVNHMNGKPATGDSLPAGKPAAI